MPEPATKVGRLIEPHRKKDISRGLRWVMVRLLGRSAISRCFLTVVLVPLLDLGGCACRMALEGSCDLTIPAQVEYVVFVEHFIFVAPSPEIEQALSPPMEWKPRGREG